MPSVAQIRSHMNVSERHAASETGTGGEPTMSKTQLDALMWAKACAAMERAERLRRQFFHHNTPHWEAPIDVFETDDALTILIAFPGVELETVKVALNAGTLIVTG